MSSPADVSTQVDIFTIGQLAFNQLDPPFTVQVAQAMEEAYQISPDFTGTPYEHEPTHSGVSLMQRIELSGQPALRYFPVFVPPLF